MLHVKGLVKSFRGEALFRGVEFNINQGDRIGLVGDNGTGKSTLMKMVAGLIPPDDGAVMGSRDLTFGYLPQEGLIARGRSLFEEALTVFDELRKIEAECREIEHRLTELDEGSAEYERAMERYSVISHHFRVQDGYSLEARVGSVLKGLGFAKSDWERPCEEFSGGWQMRIALAKLLLAEPKVLLLDEPTNHLDLEARNWLEEYLHNYPNAIMLVSHDRFFLDAIISRVIEIRHRDVHFYAGNYTEFLRQREERLEQLRAAYEAQQEQIARIKAFADKFRYKATKAAAVQSRLKELDRMEHIELPPETKTIRLRFPEGPRTGRTVLELKGVTAGYGDFIVFRDLDLLLERGERVALVGPNGAGKSTLMKVLAGRLPLQSGARREGHNVVVAYFSQDQDDLIASPHTVWEEVYAVAPNYIVPELRTLLGCFLFSGDTIEKPIAVLSGGERSRVALCRLLFSPANCLLLDEPTNHLDLRSKDVLMEALADYSGTLVFVSHDRYFLDGVATRVLEIGNESAVSYVGNYEDYLRKEQEMEAASQQPEPVDIAAGNGSRLETARPKAANKKVNRFRVESLKDQIVELETRITGHESLIADLSQRLASEELHREYPRFRSALDEHDQLKEELEGMLERWEELHRELETFQS